MSEYILYQNMLPAPEQIVAMTGLNIFIATLTHIPVKLILDNQSTAPVVLSISLDSGETMIQWKTFAASEAIILDDDFYTFPKGTQFYGNGAASGSFSISYTYANQF
jgi:ABC-type maltose transport system permease subunit